ncbi:hypothetical protein FOZ63_007969 [Perkinsus olseni]|uniref:Uncharacterized protein n=1 Tax=Perkinsus olseni TaxID=32597 RepID=A0A7J6RPB9_PEROL|nr:hypothetical protein FOZ63_007969 [Perkinsus olseni]
MGHRSWESEGSEDDRSRRRKHDHKHRRRDRDEARRDVKKEKSRKKHRRHHHKRDSRSPSVSSRSSSSERAYYDEDRAVSLTRDCILHDPRSSGTFDRDFNPRKKLRHLLRVFGLREGTGSEWFAPTDLKFNLKRHFKKCAKQAQALAEENQRSREVEEESSAIREEIRSERVSPEAAGPLGPQLPWSREQQVVLAEKSAGSMEQEGELGPLPEGEERAPRRMPGPTVPSSGSGSKRASWMTDCPEGMKDIWASKEELKAKAEKAGKRQKSAKEVAEEEEARREVEKYSQAKYGGKSLVEIYSEGHFDKKEQVSQLRKLRSMGREGARVNTLAAGVKLIIAVVDDGEGSGKVDLWGKNAAAQRREETLRQKRLEGDGDDGRASSGMFNAATAGMPGRSEGTVTASGRKMFDPTTDLQGSKFGRGKDDLARMIEGNKAMKSRWAELKDENDRLRAGLAEEAQRCTELEQELAEAKTDRSAMAALLETKADEIEKSHRALREMDERNRDTSESFEQADREVHSLRGDCKKLADLLEGRDSEIEELREAKAHSGEVSEKLARDLAARDQQLAHAMENLAGQKTTFDKAIRDVEILRKLNEQKDVKIAALTKEKSRLIQRLTQLRATTAAKKARTQREGRAEREAVRDPGVLNAVKTAARRASAPVKVDRCGEGDDLGELRRTLAEANRELRAQDVKECYSGLGNSAELSSWNGKLTRPPGGEGMRSLWKIG